VNSISRRTINQKIKKLLLRRTYKHRTLSPERKIEKRDRKKKKDKRKSKSTNKRDKKEEKDIGNQEQREIEKK
jgi:hypothetical protein